MDGEWRCTKCGKLLGVVQDERLHLRLSRGHEYMVGFPVTSVCRGCRTLNEFNKARPLSPPSPAAATRF